MVDDVTVCIPTIPGREALLHRAVASATGQAHIAINHGTGAVEDAYLNWWLAIHKATTPYVALLFDDDWYEPTFIARTRECMGDSVAWVATNAFVHSAAGTSLNLAGEFPSTWPSGAAADGLVQMPYTITPSCVLMRRAAALSCLLPGGVPSLKTPVANAGCDVLMLLFMLTMQPTVEWIGEPLVNLDGNSQSTTIRELAAGGDALRESYKIAKMFFVQLMQGAK